MKTACPERYVEHVTSTSVFTIESGLTSSPLDDLPPRPGREPLTISDIDFVRTGCHLCHPTNNVKALDLTYVNQTMEDHPMELKLF